MRGKADVTRTLLRDADTVKCLSLTDFVAEVGDDRCVATGANFVK